MTAHDLSAKLLYLMGLYRRSFRSDLMSFDKRPTAPNRLYVPLPLKVSVKRCSFSLQSKTN